MLLKKLLWRRGATARETVQGHTRHSMPESARHILIAAQRADNRRFLNHPFHARKAGVKSIDKQNRLLYPDWHLLIRLSQ